LTSISFFFFLQCLSGQDILTALSIANGSDLQEEQFEDLSQILLYIVLTLRNNCHAIVQPNNTASYYQVELRNLVDRGNDSKVDINDLKTVLESVHDFYEDHLHSGDNDHDDDVDGHGHAGEDDHNDNEITSSVSKKEVSFVIIQQIIAIFWSEFLSEHLKGLGPYLKPFVNTIPIYLSIPVGKTV